MSLVAEACEDYHRLSGGHAVLVGGAATAIYTDGRFLSGDFDIVAADDVAFDSCMLACGFQREDRWGHLLVGYYHPEHPGFGVQQVSGPLFDGRAERSRLVRVVMTISPERGVILPAVEDLIADRLSQHAAAPASDGSRLRQAMALLQLADALDLAYLRRRTAEEGADIALLGL